MKPTNRICFGSLKLRKSAFTLLELSVIVGLLALGGLLLVPALARTKPDTKGIRCRNNLRRFTAAWTMYANDYSDRLANNFDYAQILNEISARTYGSWANDIMTWDTDQMNTNVDLLSKGVMSPYLGGDISVYKCPADEYLSSVQVARRFPYRGRSISMNALLGAQPGFLSSQYVQYAKRAQIPKPASTWVVLDEHPDSINDGYFINDPRISSWGDIPASYHNGGCGFGFADGHSEIKKWLSATSQIPVRYAYVSPVLDPSGRLDFAWYLQRTGYADSRTHKPLFGN